MTYHDNADLYFQYCTAFPVGTALAQTWDVALMERFGQAIAAEMQEFHKRSTSAWVVLRLLPQCGAHQENRMQSLIAFTILEANIGISLQTLLRCYSGNI